MTPQQFRLLSLDWFEWHAVPWGLPKKKGKKG